MQKKIIIMHFNKFHNQHVFYVCYYRDVEFIFVHSSL